MVTEYKFFINGEWRTSPRKIQIKSPFNGEIAGEVYLASPDDLEDAVISAQNAFEKTKEIPSHKRAEILEFISNEIAKRREDFAQMITREMGKPITFSRAEVDRAIFTFKIASEEAKRINGEIIPLDLASHSEKRLGLVKRFPIGIILAITPFNFPLNLVAHKVAPAIASGNAIILKPSSQAPIVSIMLAEIIEKSGYPAGGFNLVPCKSDEIELLVRDERIKMVTFTGSSEVGWRLKNIAGKKKVTLELGGNAAVVVEPDANLDFAVKRIALGSFGQAGQSCIAVQRIYVHKDIYPEFEKRFVEETKKLKVGNPFEPDTIVGPLVDENAAIKTENWVNEAVKNGAKILTGGKRNYTFYEPTILIDVKPDMKVSCQEVFAPVVTLEKYDSFEEAIQMVNNSRYGLQAGIFTNNIKKIFYAFDKIDVGGVIINDYPTYRIDHMPYGGVKDSGFGREGLKYAIEEMTELKLMVLNLA
ncbi:aldehyde dehydrogenase family protein [Candidatus Kryptobacter tengchongensis]|uniref:Glyceraldehyde-3-phosphate dehydrogenase (NADP+) n=1 Tax=Kryptobacter tengchongensis TaxID=1643429 RepID=A0A916LKN5_KRYT1|nr:aldehyde dehydrogenase family protein [Candidatus Kryptobacter tengchongensis]CUT04289.1 glyceraldehyde-3-phosphate dehydrogenase (NADP+) [Candidatus Kryptobacter tengchongensis]